jgi:hypothetical protein
MTFSFIIGRGRSGTDLLVTLLNKHPDIYFAPESLFVMNLYKKYRNKTFTAKAVKTSFYRDLWKEIRLSTWWNIDKAALKKEIIENPEIKTFKDACIQVYHHQAVREGKREVVILGDKNPTYTLFVQELKQVFPESKIIYMVRDYRDNILSYQNVDFDLNNTAALAERWRYYNAKILQSYSGDNNAILLKYEDLISDAEKTLKQITDFLQVDYHPEMLQVSKSNPNNLRKWQQNLAKPIEKSFAFKWKKQMAEKDVKIADTICKEVAEALGYKPKYQNSSLPFSAKFGKILGRAANFIEQHFFDVPFEIRNLVLTTYRVLDKSITFKEAKAIYGKH